MFVERKNLYEIILINRHHWTYSVFPNLFPENTKTPFSVSVTQIGLEIKIYLTNRTIRQHPGRYSSDPSFRIKSSVDLTYLPRIAVELGNMSTVLTISETRKTFNYLISKIIIIIRKLFYIIICADHLLRRIVHPSAIAMCMMIILD